MIVFFNNISKGLVCVCANLLTNAYCFQAKPVLRQKQQYYLGPRNVEFDKKFTESIISWVYCWNIKDTSWKPVSVNSKIFQPISASKDRCKFRRYWILHLFCWFMDLLQKLTKFCVKNEISSKTEVHFPDKNGFHTNQQTVSEHLFM